MYSLLEQKVAVFAIFGEYAWLYDAKGSKEYFRAENVKSHVEIDNFVFEIYIDIVFDS